MTTKTLVMDRKMLKMLTAYQKIEDIYDRDQAKWTPLQRWSTINFLNGEARDGIFKHFMKLVRKQHGSKS